jgi:hypothetical protein
MHAAYHPYAAEFGEILGTAGGTGVPTPRGAWSSKCKDGSLASPVPYD